MRAELEALVAAGCPEITVDEPSMSCYAYREDPSRFVRIFNDTVEPVVGRTRLSTHLCFGNYKGRAVGPRHYAPMFPAFLDFPCRRNASGDGQPRIRGDRMYSRQIAKKMTVAVGIIDVKSYYIETPEDVADADSPMPAVCAAGSAVVCA